MMNNKMNNKMNNEEILNEVDELNKLVDEFSELLCYSNDITFAVEQFNINIKKIEVFIKFASENNNSYLNGLLLIGIISAFEGFIHEVLKVSCDKPIYISKAMKRLSSLPIGEIEKFHTLKNVKDEITLKKRLLENNFNDPVKINRVSKVLFGFSAPEIDEIYTRELIDKRNALIHNNGFYNGCYLNISLLEINKSYEHYFLAVNDYVSEIEKHLENISPL